jgi:putative transposase
MHHAKGLDPGLAVHDDLCTVTDTTGRTRHRFSATAANRLWLTDNTEHPTGEGKIYCCAVKDVFSSRIVGYVIDSHMRAELAVRALNNAVAIRGGLEEVAGCIVHSDRGGQFRSWDYLATLQRYRMVGSMGRGASCGGNAAMESFFALTTASVA